MLTDQRAAIVPGHCWKRTLPFDKGIKLFARLEASMSAGYLWLATNKGELEILADFPFTDAEHLPPERSEAVAQDMEARGAKCGGLWADD